MSEPVTRSKRSSTITRFGKLFGHQNGVFESGKENRAKDKKEVAKKPGESSLEKFESEKRRNEKSAKTGAESKNGAEIVENRKFPPVLGDKNNNTVANFGSESEKIGEKGDVGMIRSKSVSSKSTVSSNNSSSSDLNLQSLKEQTAKIDEIINTPVKSPPCNHKYKDHELGEISEKETELDEEGDTKKENESNAKKESELKKENEIKRQNEATFKDQEPSFSSLMATVSSPSISKTNLSVKTRANRSRSVSKLARSKEQIHELIKDEKLHSKKSMSKSRNTSESSLSSTGKNAAAAAVASAGSTKSKLKQDKFSGRLRIFEDGSHQHVLKSTKRQEKISTMIKNMLGAKKLRDESVSAVSNILPNIMPDGNVPPSLMSNLMNTVYRDENGKIEIVLDSRKKNAGIGGANLALNSQITEEAIDARTFAEKYGSCVEVIGRGTFGVVKISHKRVSEDKENLYAVKEFRKRVHETEKEYSERLAREFCISSSLKSIHIIQTFDLLKDARGDYCEVMEFCTGGDLYTLIISAGKLEYIEADCFFKQLVKGVCYMHTMGVAHRDIKPENILLTEDGNLKITDFGTSECFSIAWEKNIHLFQGLIGSAPYIAPELYNSKKYDLRPADVWACGVVYMAMRTGRQLWRSANVEEDEFYQEYLKGRKDANGYLPIESLKRARCRNVIYSILDPVPSRRISAKTILNTEWGREIRCCEAGDHGTKTDRVVG